MTSAHKTPSAQRRHRTPRTANHSRAAPQTVTPRAAVSDSSVPPTRAPQPFSEGSGAVRKGQSARAWALGPQAGGRAEQGHPKTKHCVGHGQGWGVARWRLLNPTRSFSRLWWFLSSSQKFIILFVTSSQPHKSPIFVLVHIKAFVVLLLVSGLCFVFVCFFFVYLI